MEWDIRGDLPIYSQLIYQIKFALASGILQPGQKLPSVRDLALEAKVNPNTMQRAFTELEREGLVYSQRTSGRFVTEDLSRISTVRSSLAEEQLNQFLGAMKKLGFEDREITELIEYHGKEQKE